MIPGTCGLNLQEGQIKGSFTSAFKSMHLLVFRDTAKNIRKASVKIL